VETNSGSSLKLCWSRVSMACRYSQKVANRAPVGIQEISIEVPLSR
jgi:hypothetical protein